MKRNDFFYIYDYRQAQFFIKNGGNLIEIAPGSKGDIYHKFPRDEQHEILFLMWKKQKYGDKAI